MPIGSVHALSLLDALSGVEKLKIINSGNGLCSQRQVAHHLEKYDVVVQLEKPASCSFLVGTWFTLEPDNITRTSAILIQRPFGGRGKRQVRRGPEGQRGGEAAGWTAAGIPPLQLL
ncbi:MAG TPA: hypothetical protein VLL49_04540 [Anaerolineales bacterium]|nr:hypothetical protein [Anaerolineales bacterium]